jgi:hypothetical protein
MKVGQWLPVANAVKLVGHAALAQLRTRQSLAASRSPRRR